MYDRILLPYDGSEGATEVLHHAGELAQWADATIEVLYVADTDQPSVTVVEGSTVDAQVREGEEIVEEAAQTLRTLGVEYETDVVQGNPAPTIVDYADRYDLDLIVMSTHGREGVSRYLLGSVAEKVVRLSAVPVLSVRMQPDETLAFPYEAVLVPTDGSDAATSAADHLCSFAAALDATVHVLSVVDETIADLGDSMAATAGEDAAAAAIDEVVALAEERDVPETITHVDTGTPEDAILEYIGSSQIDLVGMGTTGRRGTERILLGSVAEKTVRSAPVPVMTVANPE